MDSNEQQAHALIEKWAKAVREANLDGVIANHTDDIVMFDVPPPLTLKGIKSYKKVWPPFFSFLKKGGKFNLSEIEVAASENVAFCHALLTVGEETRPSVRLTVGLKKLNGQWYIAHEHHSAPYES